MCLAAPRLKSKKPESAVMTPKWEVTIRLHQKDEGESERERESRERTRAPQHSVCHKRKKSCFVVSAQKSHMLLTVQICLMKD